MTTDRKISLEVARAGAAVVRQGFDSRPEVRLKGDVDPVTVVDEEAEAAIFAALDRLCPGEHVLGEESGGSGWDTDRVWIVDPLDGTVNFVHGMPHVAVSVAVWEKGRPVAGCVIDVTRGEEFSAATGSGAYLGDEAIRVSSTADLNHSLIATGFPYDRQENAAAYADTLGAVLSRVQGIRRVGSAALDLAWVACGRYDGFWEYSLAPWDVAAGSLIVSEAGGMVTDPRGEDYKPSESTIVATNGRIHGELRQIVAHHLPDHLA